MFDKIKPSRSTFNKTIELLRKYCLGDREINFSVLDDPSPAVFGQYYFYLIRFNQINFLDGNYNIQMPIFAIHGNHDAPASDGASDPISALEILSSCGLINYIGRSKRFIIK